MSKTTNRSTSRNPFGVAFTTVAVFLAVLFLLTWRLQSGQDPVVGASALKTVNAQPVVHQRLIIKRKVVKLIRDLPPLPPKKAASSGSGSGSAGSASSGTSQSSYSAPQQTTVAPAPVAAPAPATSAS